MRLISIFIIKPVYFVLSVCLFLSGSYVQSKPQILLSGGGTDLILNAINSNDTTGSAIIITDNATYTETAANLFVGPRYNATDGRRSHDIFASPGTNPTINMDGGIITCYGGAADFRIGSATGGRLNIVDTLVGASGVFWYINQENGIAGPGTSCQVTLENLDIESLTGRNEVITFGAGGDDASPVLSDPSVTLKDVTIRGTAAVALVAHLMVSPPSSPRTLNIEDSQLFFLGGGGRSVVSGAYGLGNADSLVNISNSISYANSTSNVDAFSVDSGVATVDHCDLVSDGASANGVQVGANGNCTITNSIIRGETGTQNTGAGVADAIDCNVSGSSSDNIGFNLTNVINEWPVYGFVGTDTNNSNFFRLFDNTLSAIHGTSSPLGSVGLPLISSETDPITGISEKFWKIYH